MAQTTGCIPRPGTMTRRQEHAWLAELDPYWLTVDFPDRCHDCWADLDGHHHPYCCVAACSIHDDDQRLACPCDDDIPPPS